MLMHLVIGNIIKHFLYLSRVLHRGGHWVRGAQGVYLHGLKTLA